MRGQVIIDTMPKTTADLRTMTIAELRVEAHEMNARLAADSNDAVAYFASDRIEAEVRRRGRLCCAGHPVTNRACALLIDHGSYHRSLSGDRW